MFNMSYVTHYLEYIVKQQMRGFSVKIFIEMSFALIIILFLTMFIYSHIKSKKISWISFFKWSFLLVYACFMFHVAIYRREPGTRFLISTDINFGSLSGNFIAVQQVVYCVLNMLFFIPLGALFLLNRWQYSTENILIKETVMVTLCCFLASFLIECTQLLTATGYFELTDIVVNTAGGFVGALLMSLLLNALQKIFFVRRG